MKRLGRGGQVQLRRVRIRGEVSIGAGGVRLVGGRGVGHVGGRSFGLAGGGGRQCVRQGGRERYGEWRVWRRRVSCTRCEGHAVDTSHRTEGRSHCG